VCQNHDYIHGNSQDRNEAIFNKNCGNGQEFRAW